MQRQQGRSGQWRVSSRPAAASLVKPSTTINTGTERIGASDAALPVATCAVRTTRLPVMCAANSPPSPRKLMTNVDGARYDPERARQQLGAERAVPERATARALIRSLAGRVGPADAPSVIPADNLCNTEPLMRFGGRVLAHAG